MSLEVSTKYKDYPCKGESLTTYTSVPDPVSYRDERARDHRAKPAMPFLNPTSRTLASTRSMSYGQRQYSGTPLKEVVCGGSCKPGHPWCWERTVEQMFDYYPLYPSTEFLSQYLTFEWEPWQNQLRNRVADFYLNVGEDVVQWKQAVTFYTAFTDAAEQAWAAYQYARKGFVRNLFRKGKLGRSARRAASRSAGLASKATAGAVLGWNFGTAPTLTSLQESLRKLTDYRSEPSWEKLTVFQTSSAEAELVHDSGAVSRIRGTKTRRYVFYAKKTGVNQSHWTMGNPAELLWNLMPFSWLIDYGIGVGDYLTQMGALVGCSLSDGSVTEKGIYNATQEATYGGWATVKPAMGSHEYHVRSVIKSNEVPLPEMDWWKPSPTWNQLVNTTAVWRTLRK